MRYSIFLMPLVLFCNSSFAQDNQDKKQPAPKSPVQAEPEPRVVIEQSAFAAQNAVNMPTELAQIVFLQDMTMSNAWGAINGVPKVQLGVNVEKPDATLTKQLDLPVGAGLVVLNVAKASAAEAAMLETHDVMLKFNDQWLVNEEQLRVLVSMNKVGDKVVLTVVRGGKQTEIQAVLKAYDPTSVNAAHADIPFSVPFNHSTAIQGLDCKACHMSINGATDAGASNGILRAHSTYAQASHDATKE